MENKTCKLGLWDTRIPGITFDEEGVSNYAHYHNQLLQRYPRGSQGKEDWMKIVDWMKKSGKNREYDCVMGVSGGTDSSYLLVLAKEWGLRVLAVTVDNGFNTIMAINNIQKMVTTLKYDLHTYVINYEDVKKAIKAYMYATLPWIDAPTDLAIKSTLIKVAAKYKIKYVLNGHDFRTEGKQPFLWTASDDKQMRYLTKKYFNTRLGTFPALSPYQMAYYAKIYGIRRENPFYYIDYNKQVARELLSNEYNWEYYGEHHHENTLTKFVLSYWLYKKFGIDKRIITYSAQVLSGYITRAEATSIINRCPYDSVSVNEEIAYILKKLDMSKQDFDKLMVAKNHNVFDYPSYFDFIYKHPKTSSFLIRNVLGYTPLFLDQLIKGK